MEPFDLSGTDKEYHIPGIPCLHSTFDACVEAFAPYVGPSFQWRSKLVYGVVKLVNIPVQKKLVCLQKKGSHNWFHEGVEQLYLECREGLPFFNHFYARLNLSSKKSYVGRVADVINATRHIAQSSESVGAVFRRYRQAGLVCDSLLHGKSENRFIILCNGKAYSFSNRLISTQDIERILDLSLPADEESELTIGDMSACRREDWYHAEQVLSVVNNFTKTMQSLRNADFIICLDNLKSNPDSSLMDEQFKFRCIQNRFFDKSIQVVIDTHNTYLLFEHAAVDGQHAVELCDELVKCISNSDSHEPKHNENFYEELKFSWGNHLGFQHQENISSYVRAKKSEFIWLHFLDKRFNKAFFDGLPGDSIIQLSTQLAYYRCTEKFPSVYEPVSLRHIPGRRLDFISSFSNAAKNFIHAAIRNDSAHARSCLSDAIIHHRQKIKHAKKGIGSMSHIMALSAVEFSGNKIKGIRIQRTRKSVLAKLSNSFKYLIRRDLMASNGGGSDYVSSFGTIIHQPDMVGIGYLVNKSGLSVDLQVHGSYRAEINPHLFLKHLAESVFYITSLLRESPTQEFLSSAVSTRGREI